MKSLLLACSILCLAIAQDSPPEGEIPVDSLDYDMPYLGENGEVDLSLVTGVLDGAEANAKILEYIDAAEEKIYLMAPTIVTEDLAAALIEAVDRNVLVVFIVEEAGQTGLTTALDVSGAQGVTLEKASEIAVMLTDDRYLVTGPVLAGDAGEIEFVDLSNGGDSVVYMLLSAYNAGTPIDYGGQ